MADHKVVIAVPLYKDQINALEKASLLQLFSVLDKHPICFFTHRGLDLTIYNDLLKDKKFNILYFDSLYFKSITGYNLLLCNKLFYNSFREFDFMMIYQLDAWVFRDELLEWCNLNYAYIGAPWFTKGNPSDELSFQFSGVGNGGFSLRCIKSHLKALNSFAYIKSINFLIGNWLKNKFTFRSTWQFLANLTIKNNTFHLLNNYCENEDIFWGKIVGSRFSWFKLPDMLIAAKFSFEVNARALMKINANKLPFGCHAWEKYETEFWREYIDVE